MTKHGVFSVPMPFDRIFMHSVMEKLQIFWTAHVLPSMVQELTGLIVLNNGMLTTKINVCRIIEFGILFYLQHHEFSYCCKLVYFTEHLYSINLLTIDYRYLVDETTQTQTVEGKEVTYDQVIQNQPGTRNQTSTQNVNSALSTKTHFVKVCGLDIFKTCIDGLLPGCMINDKIVDILIA